MRRIIAKIVHYFNPKYFVNCSYDRLGKWGIEDVYKGKIYFDCTLPQPQNDIINDENQKKDE